MARIASTDRSHKQPRVRPLWAILLVAGALAPSGCDILGRGGAPEAEQAPEQFDDARVKRFEIAGAALAKEMREKMRCEDVTLTYELSEQSDGWTYDIYTAEGCGQKTGANIKSKPAPGNGIQYSIWLVPPAEALEAEARSDLTNQGGARLGCDTGVSVTSSGELAPGQANYTLTVNAKGCGKSVDFTIVCGGNAFDGGRHKIKCH